MTGRIRDNGRSHFDDCSFDSQNPQHFVCGGLSFVRCGSRHNDISGGFVRDVFSVLTQHRQSKEFDRSKNQQEKDRKNDREFDCLRASSGATFAS
jgi:hypothetical protein